MAIPMEDDELVPTPDIDRAFIGPPEAHHDTDEDSGDDDSGGSADDVSGRQPRAGGETNFVKIGVIARQTTVTVTTTISPIHPCPEAPASPPLP